jgi:ribonuclease Z
MNEDLSLKWHKELYSDLDVEGLSLSGIRTAFYLPKLQAAFDVASGLPFILKAKKFFVTHGHLDHASGIPYIISQKAMRHEPCPVFYMPPSLIDPLSLVIETWGKIEGHSYSYDFQPAKEGQEISIHASACVVPFRTVHRVDSLGYAYLEKKKKLKSEYAHLDQKTLRDLGSQTEINEIHITWKWAFTGDTQIEFLDLSPAVRKSEILFLEATYWDKKKTIAQAKEWGHTHLDEIIHRLHEIESQHIVLIHASSRYSSAQLNTLLDQKVPAEHRHRISFFLGR